MKETKRPNISSYWESANIETLHRMSRKWLSDFGFYKDELHFMQNLLQKHFLYFFEKERVDTIQPLVNRISSSLKIQLADLEKAVSLHEVELAKIIKSGDKINEKSYRVAHAKLNERVWQYDEDLKLVKQELFGIAEKVLKEEKMKFLLETSS
jgi:hypothetical protein